MIIVMFPAEHKYKKRHFNIYDADSTLLLSVSTVQGSDTTKPGRITKAGYIKLF